MRIILIICLVVAPFCLALGITMPLMRFETLYFFNKEPSLVEIVKNLATDGDWALAAIVALVSILFPVIKLLVIFAEAIGLQTNGSMLARLLPQLARWSLMDVLIVALVIVAAKTGGLVTALSQPGLWFYAASAIVSVLAHMLVSRIQHMPEPES